MVELIIQQEINSCHATSLKTEQAIKHAQAHFLGGSVQKFELPTIPTMYIETQHQQIIWGAPEECALPSKRFVRTKT